MRSTTLLLCAACTVASWTRDNWNCGGPWSISVACVDVMRVKLEGRSLWRSTHFGGPVAESVLLGALPVQRRARLDALCSVCRVWGQLDAAIAPYVAESLPRGGVSGGLYLYPEQLAFFVGAVKQGEKGGRLTVCETGFAGGHSAAAFLASSDRVDVVSFDTMSRPYQQEGRRLVEQLFPGRLRVVVGDSSATVPLLEGVVCDMVHPAVPHREQIDLMSKTNPGVLLCLSGARTCERRLDLQELSRR